MKTVIFDVGETLLQGMVGMESLIGEKVQRPVTLKDLSQTELYEYFRGEISEMSYWQRVKARYGWDIDEQELSNLGRQNFRKVPGTLSLAEALKAKGHRLGVLSIHGKEWVEDCERRFRYQHLFHFCSYSYHEGLLKPDPRSFMRLLEHLGDTPENCVFIDDNPRNIEGATKLGMTALLFTDAATLERELRNIDLL